MDTHKYEKANGNYSYRNLNNSKSRSIRGIKEMTLLQIMDFGLVLPHL